MGSGRELPLGAETQQAFEQVLKLRPAQKPVSGFSRALVSELGLELELSLEPAQERGLDLLPEPLSGQQLALGLAAARESEPQMPVPTSHWAVLKTVP
jgi:hypothetical protein